MQFYPSIIGNSCKISRAASNEFEAGSNVVSPIKTIFIWSYTKTTCLRKLRRYTSDSYYFKNRILYQKGNFLRENYSSSSLLKYSLLSFKKMHLKWGSPQFQICKFKNRIIITLCHRNMTVFAQSLYLHRYTSYIVWAQILDYI